MVSAELSTQEIAAIRRPLSEASVLPTRCYTDPDYYELEKERVLRRAWLAIGRWDQIENPGDFFTHDILGESVILVRDPEGVARCFSNVCRHRRMPIASGGGSARSFQCPYHCWTYGLDGQLIGAPLMADDFDKSGVKLAEVRCEEWAGFVFINFDESAAPLAPQLKNLSDLIAPYQIDTWRMVGESTDHTASWNWKLTIENGGESYHHMGLHSNTLERDVSPTRLTVMPEQEGPYLQYMGAYPKGSNFLMGWDRPELPEEDLTWGRIVNVFPLCNFDLEPDWLLWQSIVPGPSVDRHQVRYFYMVPPGAQDHPEFDELFQQVKQENDAVMLEDRQGCERWWSGQLANATAQPTVGLSPLEAGLANFHHWLVELISKP